MELAQRAADDCRQRQARALGAPTRHAIFLALASAGSPVKVAALTQRFALNHNAIRQHLAKLLDAGLIVEESGPQAGRGRPARFYRLAPSADAWLTGGPYEQLALMLLRLHQSGGTPRQVGAEAGRQIRPHDADVDAAAVLELEMARRGFLPRRTQSEASLELILDRCPFAAAAAHDPDVICEMHRGLAEGIIEAVAGQPAVVEVVRRPPEWAGCRLKL